MRQFLGYIFGSDDLQAPVFTRWQALYQTLFNSRWTLLFLLIVGIVRAGFFLLAYAPADGADGADYYTYAAYIAGIDLPDRAASVSPVYPLFVYVNHYVLGNFDLIIWLQMALSASLGILMYIGMRRYNALLAFVLGLVLLGDAQIGVLFNFTSTEPVYIFLLCAAYALLLISAEAENNSRAIYGGSALAGVLLLLLRETRTVARYLFAPIIVLFALRSRDWRRILAILAGLLGTWLLFSVLMRVPSVEQSTSVNTLMYARPLLQYDLLDANHGTASTELARIDDICRASDMPFLSCLEAESSDLDALYGLLGDSYTELLAADPLAFIKVTYAEFWRYLRSSGQQYAGTPTPADAQCEDIPARVERQVAYIFDGEWETVTRTPEQRVAYIAMATDFAEQMCPPWAMNDTVRDITDMLAFRYRSLSRPQPFLWFGVLFALILLVRPLRRLWYPMLLAGGIVAYHAAISAAVLNVQPRYIVVTNPFKAVIVITTIFAVAYVVLKAVDYWLTQR